MSNKDGEQCFIEISLTDNKVSIQNRIYIKQSQKGLELWAS